MLQFTRLEPVAGGWSDDKKLLAHTADGARCFLRIVSRERAARCAEGFAMERRLAAMGIPMAAPLECGEADGGGFYAAYAWIDGQDARAAVPFLPEDRQYALGGDAGRALRRIHSLPAPAGTPAWGPRYNAKIDRKIASYRACPVRLPGEEALLRRIEADRCLLGGRPQVFQHGDYHIGNMMLARGRIVVIDFDKWGWGDPWEEFNRLAWCVQAAPVFARGLVDGYFDGGPIPAEFWRLIALYAAANAIGSLPWAIPFGQQEIDTMLEQAAELLAWYDGMRRDVPAWYAE